MEPTTNRTPMTPSVRLWTLQVNWVAQMVPGILGRTSQGSRSPPSGADIRYRHIPEIGEQSRTIPMAHVHGRKPKNYGDIYNVRTGGRGGQGYPDTVDRFRCGQPPAASVEHQQQPGSSGAGNIQSWSAASRGVVGVAGNEGRLLAVRIQEV